MEQGPRSKVDASYGGFLKSVALEMDDLFPRLKARLGASRQGATIIGFGMVCDHVHMLLRLQEEKEPA